MDDNDLQQLIALAWDGEAISGVGPRRTLTVDQIVDEAIRLADQGGIAGASMPKLAQSLGTGTMSLYRYVPSKTVLTLLMLDRATERAPSAGDLDWAAAVTLYAEHALDRYSRHPWMLDIPTVGFPQTPRVLSWLEYGLAALAGGGFGFQDQLGSMLLVDGHVTATARLRRNSSAPAGASQPQLDKLARGRYPQLATLIEAGALADDDFGDYGYRFGLTRIIEGIRGLARPPGSGR